MPSSPRFARWSLIAAALLPIAAHAAPKHPAPKPAAWGGRVALSPIGGHVLGNPAAAHKVVEYMSYTCPHCAHFEAESAAPLRAGPIAGGRYSFEVRHLLRDGIDVTMAMLANCATPAQFFALHAKLLAAQPQWSAIAQKLPEERTKAWAEGSMGEQFDKVATDLQFYPIAASAGVPQAQAKACLANKALFERLVGQTKEAQKIGVNGTPSFVLDGKLLDAHDWAGLAPSLAR